VSSFEGEERELAMERSRAARRAAVAAAKMVASPAAIASLEQVDLSSLTGDDRSEYKSYGSPVYQN
jgi:4'-phosphopantetheinyl transferase EntD